MPKRITAPPILRFNVWGMRPAPGGSKTSGRRKDGSIFLRDAAGSDNARWKKIVAHAAADAMKGRPLLAGPLELWIEFHMPRPKSHYRTGRFARALRDDAPTWHTIAPDATKLTRSTEDAMKGIVWHDDSTIVRQHINKLYSNIGRIGARVMVRAVED